MSIEVVDAALREDFGFKHVLWVYSGRRGAHVWISDARGRKYDDHIRKSLASYLEVIKGAAQGGKRVFEAESYCWVPRRCEGWLTEREEGQY